MSETFRKFSELIAKAVGSPAAFLLAALVVVVWAASGPFFGYSDTWQLIINTGTTVVTFLRVFVIQNSQNRDTKIVALKLDELLRAHEGARTELCGLDDMSEEDLTHIQAEFKKLEGKYGSLIGDDLGMVEQELSGRRKKRGRDDAKDTRHQ